MSPSAALAGLSLTSVQGSNGTLDLSGVWMIVAEFELEGDDDACEEIGGDDCHEFEASPFLLELPPPGEPVTVAAEEVPAGVYDEFEFEVEDLDDDDEEDGEGASELIAQIRSQFDDWPEDASLFVEGTFTPTGGDPQAFRVYFDAEIEVERDLNPPLIVEEDGGSVTVIVVEINAGRWFERSDGSVIDLSQFDYGRTGALLEFEAEFEDGVMEIEIED
jgi:hypothetical protein